MAGNLIKVGQQPGINTLATNPCRFLDFQKLILGPGERYESQTADREYVMVILGGRCTVECGQHTYVGIGGRPSVWSGKPYAVYLPAGASFSVTGPQSGRVEAVVVSAPSGLAAEPFLIAPDQVTVMTYGAANFARKIHGVLIDTDRPVQRLILGETYAPSGNWSSFPPHKHDVDSLPGEARTEEMYYFKMSTPEGWGLCRNYGDGYDDVHVVRDETLVCLPGGYHTYAGAPGANAYYLWVLAGNHRSQAAAVDQEMAWMAKALPILQNLT